MAESYETYLPWLILREIPFLGNTLYKRLIKKFKSPENVLNASVKQLSEIHRIPSKVIHGIQFHKQYLKTAKAELDQISKQNFKVLALNDKRYPSLLKKTNDPPPILTYYGKFDHMAPCISIVGSRNATQYGLSTARHLAYNLSDKGFQIVSGLARGIDTMAHKGALAANGKTIAVLGSGLNKIYPKQNAGLSRKISKNGAVVSEFKMNEGPLAKNFPIRNRIIAGLSCGCVIVEAAKKSGSLITARLAADYNREVFAVPGSIKSKKSQGTHALLKQGAKLVESDMDIVEELFHFIHIEKKTTVLFPGKNPENGPRSNKNHTLLKILEPYPLHLDDIIDKSGMDCVQATAQLLELEMNGMVLRQPGDYYLISEEIH